MEAINGWTWKNTLCLLKMSVKVGSDFHPSKCFFSSPEPAALLCLSGKSRLTQTWFWLRTRLSDLQLHQFSLLMTSPGPHHHHHQTAEMNSTYKLWLHLEVLSLLLTTKIKTLYKDVPLASAEDWLTVHHHPHLWLEVVVGQLPEGKRLSGRVLQ